MKIYNDYMHDILVILLYEFLNLYKPFLFNIISYYAHLLTLIINTFFLIPKTTTLDLKKIVIVCNSKIVFCNLLNMNYYHLKINIDKNYIDIRGNKKYILFNNDIFMKYKNTSYFSIYELPIKKYEKEECCICYDEFGKLHGLCGHQIICSSCSKELNKCPVCNSIFINNMDLLEKNLYI
jgi:hypothetical protein